MLISPALNQLVEGDKFVIAEWTAEADPQWIAPPHKHHECDEAWYVLEGELEFQIDGELFTGRAGDMVWAKKGTVHTYRNPGSQPARYLLIMTPRTKALINAIHSTDDRSREGLVRLFEQFGAILL